VRRVMILIGVIVAAFAISPVQANANDGLYLEMDSRSTASYSAGNPTEWNDISPYARNGVIHGSVSRDISTDALAFDGTSFGTNYVGLPGPFDDFGNGFTMEFIVEFGADVDGWERIIDFGNGEGSDNIWVGRLGGSQDLAMEIFLGGISQGRCHTTSGLLDTRELTDWVVTLDSSLLCHVYREGIEQPTQRQNRAGSELSAVSDSGTVYPAFPNVIARTSNFVGRSNWIDDHDFEGSIELIRIHNRPPVDDNLATTGFDPSQPTALAFLSTGAAVIAIRRRRRI